MKRVLFLLLVALVASPTVFAGKPLPEASLEVTYTYKRPNLITEELKLRSEEMLLMIAPEMSRFYSVKTQFFDSIMTSPGGAAMISGMVQEAVNRSGAMEQAVRDAKDGPGKVIKISLSDDVLTNIPSRGVETNVFKYPEESRIEVVDMLGNTYYSYNVPVNDLEWAIGDSAVVVLGYECQNATTDFHGRRWSVWFAPDIPVSDGPWQLCGLPGLILKAECEGGEYSFEATGIHEYSQPIPQIPGDPAIEKIDRLEFLRTYADRVKNPLKYAGVTIGISSPPETMYRDLIENDYHND